ncbi:MAG TPA: rhomboid family intramembrane serine protease [Thermoanaerobaculia bacterium]|nr:rhomboid family intramembrane serine protease [Thermoanaerobaculia bacterium]
MKRRAPLTTALLAVITLIWLYEAAIHATENNFVLAHLGAILPGTLQRHEYWRLLAAMFLHGGWTHWAANSWALYQLGTLYEVLFGTRRFALVYFVSGICASIASAAHLQNEVAVGASGAIFGVLGAFIFSIYRSPRYRGQPWTRGLIGQFVFWIFINIVIGLSIPQIDNFAHIGGLVTGLILGFLPHREPPPPPSATVVDVEPRYHDHYRGE